MVDLSRQRIHAISLQAGPGDAASNDNRLREGAVRALGQRLASMGDDLHKEWTNKLTNRQPAVLPLLRPAQVLTRAILRDISSHAWELMSLSAIVKAWFLTTMTEQGGFQPQNWIHFIPATRPGWTTGAAATVALVALRCALWTEWKA